jgi:adhesin transport system membrane fusion protein
MRYHTIGGVVKAGEPIMEIVPTGEKLVVNTRLNPIDRAFVETGQRVTVKLSAYDFARYGGLDGKVLMVAPDSSTDDKGNPYFRLVVETEKTYLGKREGEYPISPGMQAQVDVHTGKKSVMDYLVKPVLKLKHEAFRER